VIGTFLGAQLIALAGLTGGSAGADGSVYVNFTTPLLQAITKVVLTAGGNDTFEFDNVRVSAAPLPASLWMFMSALAGLFLISRKRRLAA